MNSFGNFLWKIFSVTMAFLCHIGPNCAIAEESGDTPTITKYVFDDPKMTSEFFKSTSDTDARRRTIRLCDSGYYLSSCGLSTVGTNWLKGMSKPGNVKTPDLYTYNTSSSDNIHMENLRKFFAHTQPITYTKRTTNNNGDYEYSDASIDPDDYTPYLNQILSNFCTTDKGKLAQGDIYCEKCPNNAQVEASTVQEDWYESGKILWDSWNVHTIADCYMNQFADNTGTYVYVTSNTQDSSGKINCYYNDTVYGSSLYYK